MTSQSTMTILELIESGFDFGLDKYDIFDENYRDTLNKNILSYFMFREISYQNPTQWRFKFTYELDRLMREKYNDIYKLKQIEFNPLYNIEMTETFTRELKNTGSVDNSINSISNETGESGTSFENNTVLDGFNKTVNSGHDLKTVDMKNVAENSGKDITENSGQDENINRNLATSYPDENFQNVIDESEISYATGGNFTSSVDKKGTKTETQHGLKITTSDNGTEKMEVGTTVAVEQTDITDNDGHEDSTFKNDISTNSTNYTESENNQVESWSRHEEGSSAGLPFSKAMLQYIEYLEGSQIELMICKDLEKFFIQVW